MKSSRPSVPGQRCGRLVGTVLLVVLALGGGPGAPTAQADSTSSPLRAGVATVEINPRMGLPIVGGFTPVPAVRIHDPLKARCLILDNGDTRLGFVICDNLGIAANVYDAARSRLAERDVIPSDHLIMAATHTHSATSAIGASKQILDQPLTEYQTVLVEKIVEVVTAASEALTPAQIAWGTVDEPTQVFNRRWYVHDPELRRNPFGGVDSVRMNPPRGHAALEKPAGPTDPAITFLSVQRADGSPLALLANYSLHYVGGVPGGEISADYFAVFARKIADELGVSESDPPFVGILTNGTSGDINNINFRERGESKKPYEKMEEVGSLIARRVAEAERTLSYQTHVPLAVRSQTVTLRVRKPPADIVTAMEAVAKRSSDEKPYHPQEQVYARRIAALTDDPDTVDVRLQAVRVGNLGLVTMPFEVFVEIGLAIKSESPFDTTGVIELAGGYHGYLPTPRQHALGGYETWYGTSFVEQSSSEVMTAALLGMLTELHRGDASAP